MITYGNLMDVSIDDVLELWNEEVLYDQMNVKTFSQKILSDRNFDSSRTVVALKDGKIMGFLIGVCRKYPYAKRGLERERAFIRMIVVDKSYQRQGIGRDMLKVFEKHGYESVSGAVSMRMDFVDYVYPIVCKDSQGKIIAYA